MRIAIIGCSHSDSEYVPNNWAVQLAKRHPNIQFDNYSTVGAGQLDIDVTLKHFVKFNIEYDKVLVQFSGNNRWIVPSVGVSTDFEMPFLEWKRSSNYSVYRLDVPRARTSRIYTREELKGIAKGFWSEGRVRPEDDEWVEDQNSYNVGFAHYFSDLLMNTMEKIYPYEFKYWTFRPSHNNNIGQELCIHDWFMKNYKEDYISKFTDDTLHLNAEGNTILLNEYLGDLI